MGTISSGRRPYSARIKTESLPSVDIRRWHRDGLLVPGRTFICSWRGGWFTVEVAVDRLVFGGSMTQAIRLERTACHYGGARACFVCPDCQRRATLLYLSRDRFSCRTCLRLVYAVCREQSHERARRRAQAIRLRLGGTASLLDPFPSRPKGMFRHTYDRLRERALAAEIAAWGGLASAKWCARS